jgi:hypothetical protein
VEPGDRPRLGHVPVRPVVLQEEPAQQQLAQHEDGEALARRRRRRQPHDRDHAAQLVQPVDDVVVESGWRSASS